MPQDRYIPDFSEVPPDPADPIAIGVDLGRSATVTAVVWHQASGRWVTVGEREPQPGPVDHPGTGWRPFRCVPEYVEAEPEPVPPRRYNYISVQAPRGPDDPCVISVSVGPSPALTTTHPDLHLHPRSPDGEE